MTWWRRRANRRRIVLENELDDVAEKVSEFGQEVGREARKKGLGLWGEFKKFIKRGNVIDMAVGIAVGTRIHEHGQVIGQRPDHATGGHADRVR